MDSDLSTESSADKLKSLFIPFFTGQLYNENVEHKDDEDLTVFCQLNDIILLLQSAELKTIFHDNLEGFDFQRFANFCCKVAGCELSGNVDFQ